jgi:PAS domain S-box-containing protein
MENESDGPLVGGLSPNVTGEGQAGVDDRNSDIFFAAIETTRMPMILTDPSQSDNPIVFANDAFVTMTGYASAEIEGRNCRFLQGPETDQGTVTAILNSLAVKERIAVAEPSFTFFHLVIGAWRVGTHFDSRRSRRFRRNGQLDAGSGRLSDVDC